MLLYVATALVLVAGLGLFSMALAHKTILEPEVERQLRERLTKLTPGTPSQWGRMSAPQMLRHVAGALRMANGDLAIPPKRTTPLRVFPIKQLIVFVLPFPKGAPTAPALIVKEDVDFETEQSVVNDLLGSFAQRDLAAWPEHPVFGPLNRDQWGVLVWKHVDHHFRQFGV